MRRRGPQILSLFIICTIVVAPAAGQQPVVRWQQDLEAAKMLARQTGRLVLVHFWTPECAPCAALEKNVFNQPSVAAAIDERFVPVKLNANENPATAQGLGIDRVPMDVILTPEGQVVSRSVSPPTAAKYIAEICQPRPGERRVNAAYAATPAPAPQMNAAYAGLPVAPNTLPVAAPNGAAATTMAPPTAGALRVAATPPPAPQLNAAYAGLQIAPNTPPVVAPNGMPPAAMSPSPAGALNVPATPAPVQTQQAPPSNMNFSPPPVIPAPSQRQSPLSAAPSAAAPLTPNSASTSAVRGSFDSAQAMGAGSGDPRTTSDPRTTLDPRTTSLAQPATTTPSVPTVAAPDPKRLPPGAAPLGFDGYCPVTMRNQWKWVPGDPQWGIVHRGRTYWFSGQAEQQQFWTDPDRYAPALSGMDPVLAVDHQQQVPGKREHSIDYDTIFYLFASEATLQQFTANPDRYATAVRQAMGIPRGRLTR